MLANFKLDRREMVVLLSVLYAVVFIIMLIMHPGSDRFYTDFNNIYQILPPLFAAACGIGYARSASNSSTTRRVAWLFIGLAGLSFAIGQGTWTFYESVLRLPELPSPGPADGGYLGTYPLLITGVVLLFGSLRIAGRARLLVDSILAASSVGVLSWFFVVSKLWGNPDVTLLGKVISVAYPLGDIAVLLCAIMLIYGPKIDRSLRRSMAFLSAGIVLFAFADTLMALYNLHDAYETGSWFDWGWSFGWLLIAYASLLPLWWPRNQTAAREETLGHAQAGHGLLRILAPYLAVACSFALVVWNDLREDGQVRQSVLLIGGLLILLVIFRQVLTLFENQHLTGQLRTFNANLEKIVVRRTEQLGALLHLTKAVNTTLRTDQVMAAALENTREALQADAVVLRLLHDGPAVDGLMPAVKHLGLETDPELISYIEQLPITNYVQALPLPARTGLNQPSSGSYLWAPLRWQQRTIGMIGVVRRNAAWGGAEPEMLESIGVEVGTALENARLYGAALDAADHDSVTGLLNHRAVHQRLDAAHAEASRTGQPMSVMMMDLDNFKRFNDTYGHPIGDQILKRVASVLTAECRSTDILGRYGGDEFLVVLPYTDAAAAYGVAVRLRDAMSRAGFRRNDDQRTVPVTLSFGLATFPLDSDSRHELLTIADANLYAAKNSEEGIKGTTDNQRTNRELRTEGTFAVLDALITAVDNKDRYTRRHSEDVTDYALWIGEELGLSEETMRIIRIGCLLHDVGKIGVPDDILRKPGRLAPDEYENMKRHPTLGAFIVGALPGMESILDIVRSHHERWDGGGYPDGFTAEDIPFLGRLVAVADAFSAMTTDRPYRKGLDWLAALEEIQRNVGTQFDPVMAEGFMTAVRQRMRKSAASILAPDMSIPNHRLTAYEILRQIDERLLDTTPSSDISVLASRTEQEGAS